VNGNNSQETTSVVFPHPLKLPEYVSMDQFVFITLFNLALSIHSDALKSPPPYCQEDLYQKALELWDLAYSMQLQDEELKINYAHKLAMLTNLGHLHGIIGNRSSSKICYEHILGALHDLLRERKHDVSFWDFFFNVAHRMLSVDAAAAA
jgi:hypothetical protein